MLHRDSNLDHSILGWGDLRPAGVTPRQSAACFVVIAVTPSLFIFPSHFHDLFLISPCKLQILQWDLQWDLQWKLQGSREELQEQQPCLVIIMIQAVRVPREKEARLEITWSQWRIKSSCKMTAICRWWQGWCDKGNSSVSLCCRWLFAMNHLLPDTLCQWLYYLYRKR